MRSKLRRSPSRYSEIQSGHRIFECLPFRLTDRPWRALYKEQEGCRNTQNYTNTHTHTRNATWELVEEIHTIFPTLILFPCICKEQHVTWSWLSLNKLCSHWPFHMSGGKKTENTYTCCIHWHSEGSDGELFRTIRALLYAGAVLLLSLPYGTLEMQKKYISCNAPLLSRPRCWR
jgi:hypothetical protein